MKKNLEEKIGFLTRINNRAKKSYLGYVAAATLALGGALACSEDDNSNDAGYYEDGYEDESGSGSSGSGSSSDNNDSGSSGSGSTNGSGSGNGSSGNSASSDVCKSWMYKNSGDSEGNYPTDVPYDDMDDEVMGADMSSSYGSSTQQCKLSGGMLSWRLNTPTGDISGSEENQKAPIQHACETWARNFTNLDCGHLTNGSPRVEAYFATWQQFPCSERAIACAEYPCDDHQNLWYNDDNFRFTTDLEEARCSNAIDLESVSLHEMGHIFGLPHTDDRNAVMYKNYKPLRTLTGTDIEMLRQLYQ